MRLTNERGAALITVLLIITLISIFSVTLLFQLTSAKKQFNTTEGEIQALNLAEMGLIYMREEVKSVLPELNDATDDNIKEVLKDELPLTVDEEFPNAHQNTEYQVDVKIGELEGKSITIENTSKGTVGQYEEILSERIKLEYINNGELDFDQDAPTNEELEDYNEVKNSSTVHVFDEEIDGDQYYIDKLKLEGNGANIIINGNVYLEEGAIANNNDQVLYINGNLYSEESIIGVGNAKHKRSFIIVENDAIFKNPSFTPNTTICIKGSTNYVDVEKVDDCSEATERKVYSIEGADSNGGRWKFSDGDS